MKFFPVYQDPSTECVYNSTIFNHSPYNCIQAKFIAAGFGNNLEGKTVALAVGSRGICNINEYVGAILETIRVCGGTPFIVPAMGSHGGGTAEGQLEVLRSLQVYSPSGQTEFRASMEVEEIGRTYSGCPVYFSKAALEADYIFLINRVKEHTNFTGRIQSGIMKMMSFGLGKMKGAQAYHYEIAKELDSFENVVSDACEVILRTGKILGAIAIVENGKQEPAYIEAIKPEELPLAEVALLNKAKAIAMKIPFPEIDLLIVDEIGKDISGTGMDTNVLGKKSNSPAIKYIYVRDLSKKTAGNATGIGMADFCHKNVLDKIDYAKTYANCLSSGNLLNAKIPIHFASDEEAFDAILKLLPDNPRAVWIKNTLELDKIMVSEALVNFQPIAKQ